MADPTLKAEYLAKARKKIAGEMKAERDRLFAPRPKDATHYYEDFYPRYYWYTFYKFVGGVAYYSCGKNHHGFDDGWKIAKELPTDILEIPEEYLEEEL